MAKHAAGEGTIVERGNGGFCAAFTVGRKPNGKIDRRWIYGKTQDDVRRRLNRAIKDRDDGVRLPSRRFTVGAYLKDWLGRLRSLAPTNGNQLQANRRTALIPAFDRIRLDRLHQSDVEKLFTDKTAAGLSARTVGYIRAVLRSALQQAMRDDLLTRNVAKLARAPRVRRYRPAPLDGTQAETLLATVENDRLGAAVAIGLLGLRNGESAALNGPMWISTANSQRSRFASSFNECRIRSGRPESQARRPRQIVLSEPKSETSRRVVALPAFALDALRRRLEHVRRERSTSDASSVGNVVDIRAPRVNPAPDELVFTTLSGTPLDIQIFAVGSKAYWSARAFREVFDFTISATHVLPF